MPTLKGYECTVKGYDDPSYVVGPTASKARYRFWLGLDMDHIELMDIRVRRSPFHDMEFPDIPRINEQLTDSERQTILNAFGGGAHIKPQDWGYRDHQCLSPKDERMKKLVGLGLFSGPHGADNNGDTPGWCGAFYYLTDEGKHLARALIGARECQ